MRGYPAAATWKPRLSPLREKSQVQLTAEAAADPPAAGAASMDPPMGRDMPLPVDGGQQRRRGVVVGAVGACADAEREGA